MFQTGDPFNFLSAYRYEFRYLLIGAATVYLLVFRNVIKRRKLAFVITAIVVLVLVVLALEPVIINISEGERYWYR